jgi:hypothetical protein
MWAPKGGVRSVMPRDMAGGVHPPRLSSGGGFCIGGGFRPMQKAFLMDRRVVDKREYLKGR